MSEWKNFAIMKGEYDPRKRLSQPSNIVFEFSVREEWSNLEGCITLSEEHAKELYEELKEYFEEGEQ